ncbi:SSI family serine proteinase inhibitor [Streptosporangium sp. NPDC000396]|uniref:SSI family serine proteinase inhibitor n=1 Tax=Streptosporangium sp. NPDC000396 TaxID=3366185 RepID=UPI0036C60B1F
MRRLFCLAATGLFLLSGTTAAGAMPRSYELDLAAKPSPPRSAEAKPGPPGAHRNRDFRDSRHRQIQHRMNRHKDGKGGKDGWRTIRIESPTPEPDSDSAPAQQAALKPPAQRDMKVLVLSLAAGENAVPAERYALLGCEPTRGTHPGAPDACRALLSVNGDPAALRPPPGLACTMQYDPITVTATGVWQGRLIRYERTFGNACSLRGATGPVFTF